MSPWQVLRASRATQAALGYRVYRGLGGSVHDDSPPDAAAEAEGDGSRSFSLSPSTERVTMQELNGRLASYLQQVQDLEETNQRLEYEIQQELDRKCPRELSELDGHLRTVSLLQDQISECLSAQAQVKLQLLNAELTVVDLNLRCEKERECRGDLEVEMNNLRLLDEELHVHTLPELQGVVNNQTQELMEMQIQQKQDMQGLLTQMSGGVTVEMEPAESSNLIQQLDDLRETSETLMDRNRNECWFNTQVPMLHSPEVTFDPPPESEFLHAELEELRGRAECLEEELTQLQALNMELEASGLQQNEYFVEELEFLEQTVDGLCRDLDSVLQATAQQAADFESLLDVKTRLEAEIQAYMRLLDGWSPLGVLGLHPDVTSFCPSAFSRNSTVNKTVSVHGGSLWMMEVQTVPRGHIDPFRQTPVVTPLSETMTTGQSSRAHSKHPENSPVTSINTLNLTDSFHKSEHQITGAFPERTGRESMTVSAMINRQNSSIVCTQISQGLHKEAVTASKAETNTAQGIITLVSDTQSVSSAAVEVTPEIFTSKQNTTEAGLQADETGTNIETEVTKTILGAEAEVKEETETVRKAVEEVTVSIVSGSLLHGSVEAQTQVSTDLTLMDHKDTDKQEKRVKEVPKVKVTSRFLSADQSLTSSDSSNTKQNKVTEDANTKSSIVTASSVIPDSKDNFHRKTAQGLMALVSDTQSVSSAAVQETPEICTSKQNTTEAGLQADETGTNIETEVTKTILGAEAEVKEETHFVTSITDPSKPTAAEVKEETETVISAQINCTEDSIQAKNQEPAQVVSLSLETPAETVRKAVEEVTVSIVSGSHILTSVEAQTQVSTDLTLMDHKDTDKQEKRVKEVPKVKVTSRFLSADQSLTSTDSSNTKQNKVMEDANTKSSIVSASSVISDSKMNNQIPITKTILGAEAEVKEETETVISAQINCTEDSIQAKNQEPAQVVSFSLETPAETVRKAVEEVTVSIVSGSLLHGSVEAQTQVSTDLTLMDHKDTDKQEKRVKEVPKVKVTSRFLSADQSLTSTDSSNTKQNKVTEDANTKSSIVTASFCSANRNDNFQSKTAQGLMALVSDTQSVSSAAVQETPEICTSKQNTTEAGLQADETGTNIETEVTKTILGAEAEVKEETETVRKAVEEVTVSIVSGSLLHGSVEAQTQVSTDLTLMDHKDTDEQEKRVKEVPKVKVTSRFLSADQSLTSSDSFNTKQNKVVEDANTKSSIVTASSVIPDSKMNNQIPITKTILGTEAEVKQETHFVTSITDPSKPTAAEVKEETETVISTQINCTEDSIQAKSQEPAQVVSFSLETPKEAVRKAVEEVTVSIVSGSLLHGSVEAQTQVSTDLTLMDHKDTDKQEKRVKEVPKVKVTSRFLSADQSLTSTDSSNTKQNKVTEDANTKSSIVSASSVISDSKMNNQIPITKTILGAEAEVKEETETVISAQINCTEDSIQAKNQEPAQVVSLSLETPAEAVRKAVEEVTVSIVSGSLLHGSVEAQTQVSTDLTLMDHKDTDKQEKRVKEVPKVKVTSRFLSADQSLTSTDSSNTKQNKVIEDANTKSSIVTASSVIPDSKDNFQSKTAQGLMALVSDTQSVSSAAVEATPEICTSKQNTTEAGLQADETGTNIETEVTKTIPGAEAEVKEETETVISAQINCTEDSIQAKNQEPAQVVSLSLETPAEAVRKAVEEVTVSIVSGSHILTSVEAQTQVSTDLTLMDHKDTDKQEKRVKEVPKVKVTSRFLSADQSLTSTDSSNTKQNKVTEDANTKSSIVSASSVISDSKMNNQIPITKTILGAEAEVKEETHFVTTITDPSKPTAAEVKEETETVISAQINCTEDSIQAKNQEPAQVVSLSLETPAEAVRKAVEEVTVSIVSGSLLHGSVEAQTQVSTDLTLMDHKDTDKQEKRVKEVPKVKVTSRFLSADQSLTSSDSSNTKQNKVTEDANTKSSIVSASSVIPDSKDNFQSKTAQGLMALVSDTQSVSSAAVQETPEICTSKQNTTEAGLQADETGTNIETEVTKTILAAEAEVKEETHFVTSITDPSKPTAAEVKEETETVRKAVEEVTVSIVSGSLLHGSVEAQTQVSTDLTLMDHKDTDKQEKRVKEVPKVKVTSRFLSADQSLTSTDSSNTKQNKVTEDANTKSSIVTASSVISDSKDNFQSKTAQGLMALVSDTQSVSSAAVEVTPEICTSKQNTTEAGLQADETGTNIETEVTKTILGAEAEVKEETETVISAQINCTEDSIQAKNQEPAQVVSLSLETPAEAVRKAVEEVTVSIVSGSQSRPFEKCSLSTKKESQSLSRGSRGTGDIADNKDVQKPGRNNEQMSVFEDQRQISSVDSEGRGNKRLFVKSASFGSVRANEETNFSGVINKSGGMVNSGMASDLTARFSGKAANSSGIVSSNADAGGQGFRRDSGEWLVLGRKRSLDGSHSLPRNGKEEGPTVAINPATNPQDTGRFSSRGGGDWMVYSGSLGRKSTFARTRSEEKTSASVVPATSLPEMRSSITGSGSSLSTGSTESLPTALDLETSSSGTRKLGSRGSGEWRVYGGGTGRMSSWAGSSSLPNADKQETPQLPTSPPGSQRAGRFGSAGSGEWRVYGGSTGRSSGASSADRVSVSANGDKRISSPSPGPRLSRAGSGSMLSSGGVIRRSSSVGSGGKLNSSDSGGRLSNSSGSHRASTSGKYANSEWKPVYSSANARKSMGSAGRPGGGGSVSISSSGWLTSSTSGGNQIGSSGSGSSITGSSDRISGRAGGRVSSSSGSGRTNSTGGRVISSSQRPIRSTGSGAGSIKERISVCKMAALSISAAGREKSQDRQRQAQRSQQQQKSEATLPLLQRWLSTGVVVKTGDPDGPDDNVRL